MPDAASPLDPRLIALLTHWQFQLNCLGSVSMEVPALRPAFERLHDALTGDGGAYANGIGSDGC